MKLISSRRSDNYKIFPNLKLCKQLYRKFVNSFKIRVQNTSDIQANEDLLVNGLQARNTTVLKTVYEKYSSALFGVITRIVNDDHLAEDILQEAFLKIWNNAESYEASKGRLFTWMMNICRNAAIDKMRSKGYKTGKKTTSDETVLYENPTKIYDDIKPDTIGIKDIVDKLKPEWKELVDLIYFKGYTHQEVADELNMPLGTVKTRLRSAITLLRQKI